MDTADKVGALFARVAQVVQLTSAPRKKKLFQSQSDFEAEAVKLYAAKAKAQQMASEVKNMFVSTYGAAAWDGIQRQVIEMRKDAAREAAAALKQHGWRNYRISVIRHGNYWRYFDDYGEVIC